MPEHVLMSEIEIITDGGRRRRWTAAEKLRIVEETLDHFCTLPSSSICSAARWWDGRCAITCARS